MAVGETSGQSGPRRLVTAGGGRRRAEQGEPGVHRRPTPPTAPTGSHRRATTRPATRRWRAASAPSPVPRPAGDDFERLLAEEEEIERRTRNEHHETPHFRKESD